MYSHKRKHEKQDKRVNDYVAQQQAIANAFKNAAALMTAAGASASFSSSSSAPSPSSPNTSTVAHHFTNDTNLFPSQFSTIPAPSNGNADIPALAIDQSFSPPLNKKVATAIQNRLKLKQYDPHARTFHDAGTLGLSRKPNDVIANDKPVTVPSISVAPSTSQKVEIFDPDDVAAMGIDMSTLQSPIQFLKSVTKAETDGEIENEFGKLPCPTSISETLFGQARQQQQQQQQQSVNGRSKGDDSWKKFITR